MAHGKNVQGNKIDAAPTGRYEGVEQTINPEEYQIGREAILNRFP